jgi:hypothetical protein
MTVATAMSVNPDAWGPAARREGRTRIVGSWMGVAKGRALYRCIRTGRSECEVRPTHRAASEGRSALGVFTGVVMVTTSPAGVTGFAVRR